MAEISSIVYQLSAIQSFQCSSASRKFLNTALHLTALYAFPFQCSSASRKFLNRLSKWRSARYGKCFSALQRAENSSISRDVISKHTKKGVSVLFSEPKIPQFVWRLRAAFRSLSVSVLFSEPKIPQWRVGSCAPPPAPAFQCSSASRKFLNCFVGPVRQSGDGSFSALQRAENSSIISLV